MSYLDEQLDALVEEAAQAVGHPRPCGCARCRQRQPFRAVEVRSRHFPGCGCGTCSSGASFDEAAMRQARPAGRQTSARAAGRQLPGWRGWTRPVSLAAIDAARAAARRGEPVDSLVRPFLATGPQVYRITRAGIDRDRPLSIGMTKANSSIAQRIIEHYRQPSRADPKVNVAIRNLQPGQVLVQAARLTRQGIHPRRARNYEGWLQDRERPLLYDPNSTTFDETGLIR
ncbi:hypothetical protein EH240_03935 [Mesorhizobium tamadayense]|uniref:Uncharacterized protein n=1 Tax=Mesorhizobium tamadayense TaxID=425306 RepID=A0A3P3G6E4_9HYPH|nr:hypothetical protein [Mesorhizobium tamadayense]RRI06430.1 hypothetical protein EH240_03935 [Mesorhizobium tamadayense]